MVLERPSAALFSAEFGGRPISSGSFGVGGLGSRLDEVLLFSAAPAVLSRPFVVGGGDSIGLPFSIRYSWISEREVLGRRLLP